MDRFGVFVLNGYGQAEIGEVIGWTAADAKANPDKLGAVGRPHPGVDIKLVDGVLQPRTCPMARPEGATDFALEYVVRYNALSLSRVRKAFSDDYSDATVAAFASLLGAKSAPAGTYTGAVRKLLVDVADRAIAGAPEYRVYYHDGACHSERDADGNNAEVGSVPSCDYDQLVQDGVKFSDWVRGWMRVPGYSWNDVR